MHNKRTKGNHAIMATIYPVLVRPGKRAQSVTIPEGSTVEDSCLAAGFAESDYVGWTFTDADGETLTLTSKLYETTHILCGVKVDGALRRLARLLHI
jgi:hypothetical protein